MKLTCRVGNRTGSGLPYRNNGRHLTYGELWQLCNPCLTSPSQGCVLHWDRGSADHDQADVGDANRKAQAERCTRPAIFWYDVGIIILLAIIAIGYFEFREQVDSFFGERVDAAKLPVAALALRAMWFASLGGIVISLKGVYEHACKAGGWDDGFSLWHFGRPLSGAIAGLVTVVLLSAINPGNNLSEPVVYAAAFIFGTQEKRFFNFLYEVARLVVQVPSEQAAGGLQVAAPAGSAPRR